MTINTPIEYNAAMEIFICKECGKAKKSKRKKSQTPIRGKKIYKHFMKWLNNHPELDNIKIKKVSCLNKCSDSPVIFIKNEKRFIKSITKEKLRKLYNYLQKHPQLN